MKEFLKTKAVYTYFMLDALLAKGVDRSALMALTAKIFCVNDEQAELYARCSHKSVAEISSIGQYNRYLRLKVLGTLDGYDTSFVEDEPVDETISLKGQALTELDKLKIKTAHVTGNTEVMLTLSGYANIGIITASYLYGIILCEGLGAEKDAKAGLQYLKKAADWGNPEACVACIHYCKSLKKEYGNKLYTYLLDTPYISDFSTIAKVYGIKPEKDSIAALTKKLFPHGVARSMIYDIQIARILSCGVLGKFDKQDVLLSGGKDLIKAVNALPLNMSSWDDYKVTVGDLPLGTAQDKNNVSLALKNIDTLKSEKYRPLCICSDEHFALKAYKKAIEQVFSDCNVIYIDLSMLPPTAFAPVADNEVLKGIRENKRNIVIFNVVGEKPLDPQYEPAYTNGVVSLLQTAQRSSFKLKYGISLNLTELLPIVLCDKNNLGKFRAICQTVKLSPMTAEEKKRAIDETVADNSVIYELNSASIDDDAMKLLLDMPSNDAIDILDKLFASYEDGADARVRLSDVKKLADDEEMRRTGFYD